MKQIKNITKANLFYRTSHVCMVFKRSNETSSLQNITKNAIESMTSKGHLTIELKQVSNKCHCSITDTGIGIPLKAKKKIFKPFYTSKETGTGLGLVICKRIIDWFDGDIHISSKVNKGTTFTISLPPFPLYRNDYYERIKESPTFWSNFVYQIKYPFLKLDSSLSLGALRFSYSFLHFL